MPIWVDADACPKPVREILFRAAERAHVPLTLVANQHVRTPPSRYVRSVQVAAGFDVADNEIVRRVAAGDLVITGDIPLAAEVIAQGALALSPRGELFTRENVRAKLNVRDFMETLRASGIQSGGPPSPGPAERKAFADHLDRWLARQAQAGPG